MARGRTGNHPVSQFVRFLFVGALNTLFGYAVFAAQVLAGIPPGPALIGTYVVGVIFNYFTTGRLVFSGHDGTLARFILAYVVIYFFNWGLFTVVSWAVPNALVNQALCIPVVAVFSFLLFKRFVFRDRGQP